MNLTFLFISGEERLKSSPCKSSNYFARDELAISSHLTPSLHTTHSHDHKAYGEIEGNFGCEKDD